MTKRLVTLAAAAVVLLGLTVPAQAQAPATTTTPTFELGAGYTLLRAGEICDDGVLTEVCIPDRTFPFGLAVDAARNFGALGIVGEVGWSYDSEDDASFHVWTFAAGPRWTGRGNPRIWPYGQVLLGAAVTRLSTDIPGIDSDTSTDFMVQPGVGVNFVAGDGWSVFGQVDYRRVFVGDIDIADPGLGGAPLTVDGAGRNDIRVFLGARMILD